MDDIFRMLADGLVLVTEGPASADLYRCERLAVAHRALFPRLGRDTAGMPEDLDAVHADIIRAAIAPRAE
jgi:hypothetical protein